MSKILALGVSPLPIENEIMLSGPGIRTWQFVKPLLYDGHQVCLVCMQTPGAYKEKSKELFEKKNDGNIVYHSLPQERFEDLSCIQKIHDNFQPDCIFSISSFSPSYSAVQLKTDKPMWFDRGDLMSEAQLRASIDNNNDWLYHFLKLEELILERGDVFSSVSLPQKFALIGRLGGAGRLNKYTVGYEFIQVIPCGVDKDNSASAKNIIRGKYARDDDFIVLWSGGYNSWTDIETLFSALERAMARNASIKFVSIGGTIHGQNEITYSRFQELINSSEYKDRYIMLGWVHTKDLPNIYRESNLGVNIDKYCYEVVLGSRHRLLDWMKWGLPILTTKPSELTQVLDERKMAFTFPAGNIESLASTIISLSSEKKMLAEYSQRAKYFVQNELSYELTTESFREWVKKPGHAPDNISKLKGRRRPGSLDKKFLRNIEAGYIENLKKHINNLTDEQQNLKSYVTNLESEQGNLKTHISNLETERERLNTHTSNLEKERENLKTHISNLEKEREASKVHISSQEKVVDNLKTYIYNLKKEREKLENRTKDLTVQLNRICNSRSYRVYMAIKKILCLKTP